MYFPQGLSALSHLSSDFSHQNEGQGEKASKEAGKLPHSQIKFPYFPQTEYYGALFSLGHKVVGICLGK